MKRNPWIKGALGLAVAGLIGYAAWRAAGVQGNAGLGVDADGQSSLGVQTSNAGEVTRELNSPLVAKSAPSFQLPLAGGGSATLAQFKGKTVVITFWSTY